MKVEGNRRRSSRGRRAAAMAALGAMAAAIIAHGGYAAAAGTPVAALKVGEATAMVGGRTVDLGFRTHIIGGASWAPVRAIVEGLGGQVRWDHAAKVATATLGEHTLVFTTGSRTAMVNGQPVSLPAAIHIMNSRMQVPLAVLGRELGFSVRYDAAAGTVFFEQEEDQAAAPGRTIAMDIQGFAFASADMTVNVGDTVVWTNRDSAPHTVTGAGLDSGRLNQGDSFRFTFTAPGEYEYVCAFHPNMKAKITVRGADGED